MILLCLALSGVSIRWKARTTATIFAMDCSDSMADNRQMAEDFLKGALSKKPSGDLTGIISFADDSSIESFLSKNPILPKFGEGLQSGNTSIERAVASCISMLPHGDKKRIVLLTDGEENAGNSLKMASSLIGSGVDLKVYKIDRNLKNEAAVESVVVPKILNIGDKFNAVVNITSTEKCSAKLTLYSGSEKAFEKDVVLEKGNNRFVFKDTANEGGFRSYRAIIEPQLDTMSQNNEASTFTDVKDKPRVLVIEDADGEADEVIKMLEFSGMDYRLVSASSAPGCISDMIRYKTIITCNVSAENLKDDFLNSIESYVKDFGGGFIATGGENSFALGGYYKTPIEKVLPVNMEMKGKKEVPAISIMLVIDKSGSMRDGSGDITKVDIAKEAACRVLDSLRQGKDEIGVIAFNDTAFKVVESKKVDDVDKIKDDIGTIRADGGTSIIPALEEGYDTLKKSSAVIKHIILLTDGQAEDSGYENLLENINKDNITVSTVAVGRDSDRKLLQEISKTTGGRNYYTDEFANIPRIFAKEIFLASGSYLNNREFTPNVVCNHSILSGIAEKGLPKLLGYIGASPKDTSRVLLTSDQDDPILTIWQYGLGRSVAWNSDITGKWSANYVSWDKNLKLWQNIINWTIQDYGIDDASLEAVSEGSLGNITFSGGSEGEEIETIATVISPSGEKRNVKLNPVAPGQYGGSFDIKDTGNFMVNVKQMKNGEIVKSAATGLSVQYSSEYSMKRDSSVLDRLVRETGGRYIKKPDEVYKGRIKDITGWTDLTYVLLMLLLFLFLMDIAVRRLNFPVDKIEAFILNLRAKAGNYKKRVKPLTVKKEDKRREHEPNVNSSEKKGKDKNKDIPRENIDVGRLLKARDEKYKNMGK
ncbi:MAG TPA: hypothetical protein DD426_00970, partial [Clostridiaceae bacterium]|nr:hypothetical protein [Clostridiaceae bacterium]